MAEPLFNKQYTGTLNFSAQEAWVDLGLIPLSFYILFGFGTFIADGKRLVFDLRTNKVGFSDGSTTNTTLQDRIGVIDGDTKERDYYKNAQTARKSAVSTGVEHTWLRITSRSANNADAYWWIDYTEV